MTKFKNINVLVLPRACADRFFAALRMTGQDYSGTGVRSIAAAFRNQSKVFNIEVV